MTNEELVLGFQEGTVSFDEVYQQCCRLIFKEANRWRIRTLDHDDVVSLALEGFYEACLKFDPTRGAKFSTHSTNHIRYRLRNEYNKMKLEKWGGTSTFLSTENQMTTKDRQHYEAGLLKFWKETHEALEWEEYWTIVCSTIEELKGEQQAIVKAFLIDNQDQYEIAKAFNTSNQRIHYHVKQGLSKIKTKFQQKGWL